MNQRLEALLGPIDDLLGEFLDPERRSRPRSALIREHGHPDLEPQVLDLAEPCGNG